MGELIQFGGSLLAILALAGIAWKLGLGGDVRIRDEGHLRDLADEALPGFDPVEVAIDRSGTTALACDASGRVMLLRRHGAHFASRLLDKTASGRVEGNTLVVSPGDRRFGDAALEIGDAAPAWAERLGRL